jgi:hypothetical protein
MGLGDGRENIALIPDSSVVAVLIVSLGLLEYEILMVAFLIGKNPTREVTRISRLPLYKDKSDIKIPCIFYYYMQGVYYC